MVLRSQTPAGVEQEIYGFLLVHYAAAGSPEPYAGISDPQQTVAFAVARSPSPRHVLVHEIGFFLELDRGTEPLGRLADKLSSYRRLRAEGGPPYVVLFALPSRAREQNLHRRLADRPEPSLVIATTSPEAGSDPADPVWRLVGNGRHRLGLADLPGGHGQPGRTRRPAQETRRRRYRDRSVLPRQPGTTRTPEQHNRQDRQYRGPARREQPAPQSPHRAVLSILAHRPSQQTVSHRRASR
jgi:Replication-relaxation